MMTMVMVYRSMESADAGYRCDSKDEDEDEDEDADEDEDDDDDDDDDGDDDTRLCVCCLLCFCFAARCAHVYMVVKRKSDMSNIM